MSRSVHGIELTAAGRAFLDHARLALTQAEAAKEAARRAAQPAKPTFALGFLTGKEINWLPEAVRPGYHSGSRGGQHYPCGVLDRVDRRRSAAARLPR